MRVRPIVLLVLGCAGACGQVPTPSPAAVQAMQIAQQQSMMVMQQAQMANMQALQSVQIASQSAARFQMLGMGVMQAQMASQAAIARMQVANASMNSAQAMVFRGEMLNQAAMFRMANLNAAAAHNAAYQAAFSSAMYRAQMLRRQGVLQQAMVVQAAGQAAAAQTPGAAAAQSSAPAAGQAPVVPMPGPMVVRPTFGNPLAVAKPSFSQNSGKVAAGTKVKLKSDTHYSTLYYTTDGWTPTTESARYTGPITVDRSMTIQTIAVGPNLLRSEVTHAEYTVPGPPAPPPDPVIVPVDGVLREGTALRLVTSGDDVTSETATVGDPVTLVLGEDVKLGDAVLAAKGTKVEAVLTIADASRLGAPGDLVFEVQSVALGGKTVPLFATQTLEGAFSTFSNKDAIIKAGMPVTAFVVMDTPVKP